MAKLDGLIRVQKHRVDEKQKILARLFREQEELEDEKNSLLEQIENETAIVKKMEDDPVTKLSFGNFVANTNKKIERLDKNIDHVQTRIDLAQEDIRRAFEELKKTEIVDKNRKDKEKKTRLKKENQELDSIGIEGHTRKKSEQ